VFYHVSQITDGKNYILLLDVMYADIIPTLRLLW